MQAMDSQWLTLSEAAERLGVHPSTLRRWADKGSIPVMFTPGGHRRFALEDVVSAAVSTRARGSMALTNKQWVRQALVQTRAGISASEGQRWVSAFDEEQRLQQRELGRRLIGLLLQYISNGGADESAMLAEAHEIGQSSGRNGREIGLSLTESLEATMFFRDTVVETAIQLPKSTRARSADNLRLLRRINTFMNTVQLAIAEAYDQSHLPGI